MDENGKALAGTRGDVSDPVPDEVLGQVAGTPPLTWRHWVRANHRADIRAVRDLLEADRVIKVEWQRILGLFPTVRITLRQHRWRPGSHSG